MTNLQVLAYMYTQYAFFMQGFEAVKDLQPVMSEVMIKLL